MKRRLFTTSAILAFVTIPMPAEAAIISGTSGTAVQIEQDDGDDDKPFNCSGGDKGGKGLTKFRTVAG